MSSKARTEAIEVFSDPSPDSPTIFLMSLKAGGVGINLTAASRVFLIDPVILESQIMKCYVIYGNKWVCKIILKCS